MLRLITKEKYLFKKLDLYCGWDSVTVISLDYPSIPSQWGFQLPEFIISQVNHWIYLRCTSVNVLEEERRVVTSSEEEKMVCICVSWRGEERE